MMYLTVAVSNNLVDTMRVTYIEALLLNLIDLTAHKIKVRK